MTVAAAPATIAGSTSLERCRRSIGWALGICLLLWGMKLYLIGWYFIVQKTNPLFEAPAWAWPLVGGIDLAFCFILAAGHRLLSAAAWRIWPRRGGAAIAALSWVIGAAIILFSVVSLQVNQTYSMPLGMNLLRWADNPRVFYSSLMDYASLAPAAIVLGGWALQFPLGRWIERGLERIGPVGRSSWRLWGAFLLASIVLGGLWGRVLGGLDMLGVKHNAVVYFIRHYEPANLPKTPQQLIEQTAAVGQAWDAALRRPLSLHSPAVRPRDFDVKKAASKDGRYDFILIQLESTSARYIDQQTMPNLSRLAARGVSFSNHFTVFARTDVATYGLYYSDYLPNLKGHLRELHGGRTLPQPSLADVLRGAGYRTGVFHSGFFSFVDLGYYLPQRSFDRRVDAEGLWDGKEKLPWSWGVREERTVDALLGWIDQRDAGQADKPYMAIYATMYPHHPYWSPVEPCPFPKDTWLNRYRNALWYVDQSIGRIADYLAKTGRLDRTIFVVYGDHGQSVSDFPVGHGIRMSEEELKTPLIISSPRLFPSAQVSRMWTNHLDVAPTVAALAGTKRPDDWLGRDLLADTIEPRLLFLTLGFAQTHLILDNGVIHAEELRKRSCTLYRFEGSQILPLPADDPAQKDLNRYNEIRAAFAPWATWTQAQRAK